MTANRPDTLLRFLFENSSVRGVHVNLTHTYQTILALHDCSQSAAHLLGESLVAAAMLASTIKLEGRLALQARGEGALSLLVAECTHDGGLRGMIELDDDAANGATGLSALLQNGYLAVSLLPDEGASYQGLVPLEGDRLQECIAGYFCRSEQLPTALWLACDGTQATGLLLQALPGDEHKDNWQHLCALARTLKDTELLQLPPEQVLHRLFHEEVVRLFDPSPLTFACTCSDERSRNALALLGRDELLKLFAERETVEVDCQFCKQQYRYTEIDMQDYIGEQPTQLH